jgi:hypothetical protein
VSVLAKEYPETTTYFGPLVVIWLLLLLFYAVSSVISDPPSIKGQRLSPPPEIRPVNPEPLPKKTGTSDPNSGTTPGVVAEQKETTIKPREEGSEGNKKSCTPNEEVVIFKKTIDENIEQLKKNKKFNSKKPTSSFKCVPKAGKKILYLAFAGVPSSLIAAEIYCHATQGANCFIMATVKPNPKPTSEQNTNQVDKETIAKSDCLALTKNIPQLKNISLELKEKTNESFRFEWRNKNKLLATCVVVSEKSQYLSINKN